jgi:hypothetical protein
MPVGEKCQADFGGADHLEYPYIYRRSGNKRILKMGWEGIGWNYLQ